MREQFIIVRACTVTRLLRNNRSQTPRWACIGRLRKRNFQKIPVLEHGAWLYTAGVRIKTWNGPKWLYAVQLLNNKTWCSVCPKPTRRGGWFITQESGGATTEGIESWQLCYYCIMLTHYLVVWKYEMWSVIINLRCTCVPTQKKVCYSRKIMLLDGCIGGWMDALTAVKAILRIATSNRQIL